MKITFFGHNCFYLNGSEANLLIDPWLSDKGAFFGSWFQWPINHHFKKLLIKMLSLKKNNYLYISHEHQDHFDKETLRLIKPYIKSCIIPKYHEPFLYNEIISLGFEVIVLADKTKYYFNKKDTIELMIVDTGVNHDSAAIIRIEEEIFVNQNDCKIFDRLTYLEDIDVDYYAVQFSGASWHPVCYEMDEVYKKKISKKKVLSKLAAVRNAIKKIKPRYYIPSAGPAIFPFLKQEFSLGVDNIFVHQQDIVNFLKLETEIICPRPGDEIKPNELKNPIKPPDKIELASLKKTLTCEFDQHSEDNFNPEMLKKQILARLDKINDLKFSDCPKLIFDWEDGGFLIDLNKNNVKSINLNTFKSPKNYMIVRASKKYFGLMADPQYRWQDIYLTLRAKLKRDPEIFNTFINIFLYSDIDNIRAGFETTLRIDDERIVVVNPNNGKNYEINRFCPHNGADLKEAKIDENGNLICPRHSWAFKLDEKGNCKNAQASIDSKEILESTTLCETISVRLLKV